MSVGLDWSEFTTTAFIVTAGDLKQLFHIYLLNFSWIFEFFYLLSFNILHSNNEIYFGY